MCRDWCRGEIDDVSSLGPRLGGVLDGNVEPGWSFAVEAPMIMEFVDFLPTAERPPTASDLDVVGVSLLVLLLEVLLLDGEEIVRSNDNDSNAS